MTRKTKRAITMIVSLVLVLALGGIYFWQQRVQEDPILEDAPPLFTFDHLIMRTADEVESVRFLHIDGRSYTMVPVEQEGTTAFPIVEWQHTGHPDVLLSQEVARGKTNMAWGLTASETIHECNSGVNLADFGLSPAQLVLEVTYTDGTHTNVYVGYQTADHFGYFVMVSGDPGIHRIGNAVVARAKLTIEDMVDRHVPMFDMHAVYVNIAQRDTPEIEFVLGYEVMENMMQGLFPDFPLGWALIMSQPLENWTIMHEVFERNLFEELENFRLGPVVNLSPASLAPYGLDNPSLEFTFANIIEEVHLQFGDIFMHNDIPHIYVKFADRPHVFRAEYDAMSVLFDFDIFRIIDRIVALIPIIDVESVTVTTPDATRNVELVMNHYYPNNIDPTINGITIDDHRAFRTAYRLLIGISGEGEVEAHTPQGEPYITIVYHKLEGPDTEIRLFVLDNNFFTISVNGEDAWLVTSRVGINTFFEFVNNLLAE